MYQDICQNPLLPQYLLRFFVVLCFFIRRKNGTSHSFIPIFRHVCSLIPLSCPRGNANETALVLLISFLFAHH